MNYTQSDRRAVCLVCRRESRRCRSSSCIQQRRFPSKLSRVTFLTFISLSFSHPFPLSRFSSPPLFTSSKSRDKCLQERSELPQRSGASAANTSFLCTLGPEIAADDKDFSSYD